MKQSITFPNLIQKLILPEEIEIVTKLTGYKDTSTKLDVMTLVCYFVCAAANEWKSYRQSADVGRKHGLPQVNYSTFSKKGSHVPYQLIKELFNLIVSKCNRATRRSLKIPKKLLLVDSTTITVGKTRLSWGALWHQAPCGVYRRNRNAS